MQKKLPEWKQTGSTDQQEGCTHNTVMSSKDKATNKKTKTEDNLAAFKGGKQQMGCFLYGKTLLKITLRNVNDHYGSMQFQSSKIINRKIHHFTV